MHEIAAYSEVILAAAEPRPRSRKEDHKSGAHINPLVPTIFHEDWWLEAATGGQFEVVEVATGGRTVGRLPFHKTKRFGLEFIRMPELTYFMGPAIDDGEGSSNTRFLKRLQITRELLERLPRVSWQYVKCHSGVTEVIAFQSLGFRTYVQFTHELPPQPVNVLWRQMRNKTRNVIRRAEEKFSVTELSDPFEFLRFFERNLELEGQTNRLDRALCRQILPASLDRRRGRIIAARDSKNQIVAANFYVWDKTSSFFLMSTRSHDSGNSAISLLIWEAIKESARRGLVFDFAGLGNKGSVLLYSGFGARVCGRYAALRARPIARMIYELRCLAAPENCFY
jgi:CelD/BcsL family acetyltransferase involved in cellulose biosynthesis